ncbi:proteasome subunit beta [Tsukamurella sp. 8F]|uniref:proteasome subunit beta n=1 Tax=unclassified Tsukamurella TaxID=2633480 RepID=UPI0023B8C4C6|nr:MULTISPECIES: proteasome subunit beta [unclassified Tsukamurella]MDF0530544.1 proteasome subunit beta [Tsukamurella sp. 8J]MDF0586806.1 proteasome subunit beta [Tsukamurella sp. 8F]
MTGPLRGVGSSFAEHLARTSPESLPGAPIAPTEHLPHGTTIVALAFDGGVLLAGDRRATMGNLIAQRDIRKTYITDDHTAVGIAGTAGIAKQIVKLFTVELEHYEKIEGVPLTFGGKANRLGGMVRGNFPAAMQGLVALPLLVGFDLSADAGRIVSYDPTGDWHDERQYHAIGSGSAYAKSSLKKLYRAGLDGGRALEAAAEALFDAADDDTATGGPDVIRGLYPTAVRITADGAEDVPELEVEAATERVVAARRGEENR